MMATLMATTRRVDVRDRWSVADRSTDPSPFRSGLPATPYPFGLTTKAVRRLTLRRPQIAEMSRDHDDFVLLETEDPGADR